MRSSRAMERAMAARARWGGERRSRARARRPRGLVAMRDGVCARCRRRRCRRERSRAVDAVRVDGWWRGACVAVAMGWRWGGAASREGARGRLDCVGVRCGSKSAIDRVDECRMGVAREACGDTGLSMWG